MVSAKYLLDSNVLSQPPKPLPDPRVMERLLQHEDEIATASVVFHEMLYGALRLPASEQKRKDDLLYYMKEVSASVPILPYDEEAARWHAAERARLGGQTPKFADGQIAAIAATQGLIVVTANTKDFIVFSGLRIEDWTKA